MAFTATAGMAGLTVGVPIGADVAAEQQGALTERAVRLNRAVAARAGALQRGGFLQGRVHGLSVLGMDASSLMPPAQGGNGVLD
jgi:hypothetical protein